MTELDTKTFILVFAAKVSVALLELIEFGILLLHFEFQKNKVCVLRKSAILNVIFY